MSLRYNFDYFEMKDTAEFLCDFWNYNYLHDKS